MDCNKREDCVRCQEQVCDDADPVSVSVTGDELKVDGYDICGIRVWTDKDLTVSEALDHFYCFNTMCPGLYYKRDDRAWLFIQKHIRRTDIIDLFLKVYDTAVPQEWFDDYTRRYGRSPEAVWCYDPTDDESKSSLFGYPVFWSEITLQFERLCNLFFDVWNEEDERRAIKVLRGLGWDAV